MFARGHVHNAEVMGLMETDLRRVLRYSGLTAPQVRDRESLGFGTVAGPEHTCTEYTILHVAALLFVRFQQLSICSSS